MGASQFLLAPSILLKLYTVYIGDRRYCGCQVVAMPASTFPTMPTQPWMAISIELLSFFHAIFEHSCDVAHALAATLSTYYTRRGFHVTDHKVSDIRCLFILIPDCSMCKGRTVRDPFQRGLSQAVQWYNILQVEVEKQVDSLIQHC